jgi:hypothetical protein
VKNHERHVLEFSTLPQGGTLIEPSHYMTTPPRLPEGRNFMAKVEDVLLNTAERSPSGACSLSRIAFLREGVTKTIEQYKIAMVA